MQPRRPQYRTPPYQRPSLRPQPVSPHSVWFKRMTRKEFLATLSALVVGVLLFVFFEQHHLANQANSAAKNASLHNTADSFNKKQYSLTDPASIWIIVNKRHPLAPLDYAPADLVIPDMPLRLHKNDPEMQVRAPAAAALKVMSGAAAAQGLHFMLASGYRSYQLQAAVYGSEVRANGQSSADQESARPGYSEHQTGLAADLEPANRQCEVQTCFANLSEGKWLAANGYKYGFIVRYTADKAAVTGYEYEPWHVRYVGTSLATALHSKHVETLEEFFNVSGGPDYAQ